MAKDVWGPLVATYDEDHTYIAGADLVEAVRAQVAGAVPAGDVVEFGCGKVCTPGATRPDADG